MGSAAGRSERELAGKEQLTVLVNGAPADTAAAAAAVVRDAGLGLDSLWKRRLPQGADACVSTRGCFIEL